MELSGNLKDFPVEDIIKFLSLSKRTGVLNITGSDVKEEEVQGRLFFKEGKIINAETEKREGEDAVFHLLTVKTGSFSFTKQDNEGVKNVIDKDTEELLFEAAKKVSLLEDVIKRLPSFDTVLDINPKPSSDKISLGKNEWHILNMFRGGKSIKEVLEGSSFSEADTLSAVLSLFAAGLLTRKEININEIIPRKTEKKGEMVNTSITFGPPLYPTPDPEANRVYNAVDGRKNIEKLMKTLRMNRKALLHYLLVLMGQGYVIIDTDAETLHKIESEVRG